MGSQLILLGFTLAIITYLHFLIKAYNGVISIHLYLFSAVWLFLLLSTQFSGPTYAISTRTFGVFLAAWLLLYIGNLISCSIWGDGQKIVPYEYNLVKMKWLLRTLVFLSIIANVLFYRSLYGLLDAPEKLIVLRTEEGREAIMEVGGTFFNNFGRIYNIYLPLAVYLYKRKTIGGTYLVILLIIALITAFASLTRAPILNVLICFFVPFFVMKIKLKKLAVMVGGGAILALMIWSTALIAEMNASFDGSSDLAGSFSLYTTGSLKAYDHLLNGHYLDLAHYDVPYYSLDFMNFLLKKLGLINTYPSLIRSFTFDIETNVYTFLDAPTLDFGLPGALFGALFMGLLTGYFATKVSTNNGLVSLVMYCYCTFAFAFSFMNNEFIRSSFVIVVPALTFFFHLIVLDWKGKKNALST